MSKQLAVSAAFSVFMMAAYVLFGANVARESLTPLGGELSGRVEISAAELPAPASLLPSIR